MKRYSEKISQVHYRASHLQFYWNHTSAWVFSCNFAVYFQNVFLYYHLWQTAFFTSHIQIPITTGLFELWTSGLKNICLKWTFVMYSPIPGIWKCFGQLLYISQIVQTFLGSLELKIIKTLEYSLNYLFI